MHRKKKDSIMMSFAMPRDRKLVPASLVAFYLAIASIAYLLVIMANGFIIAVNLSNWTKGRSLTPNNEILSSLVLSNLCFSTVLIVEYFLSLLWEEFYSIFYTVQKVILTLNISTSFSSFWFTAWLSAFYCMKIVNFKQLLLLKMKLKFPSLVRWLLLGSALVSFGAAVVFQWAVTLSAHRKQGMGATNRTTGVFLASGYTHNSVNEQTILVKTCPFYKVFIIFVGSSLPLTVIVFSSVTVLYSLFSHTQKVEQNLSPSHLEAHIKAAKAVWSLLLCYVIWVVCQILVRIEIYRNWYYQYFLFLTVQLATLLAQSTILILSNPKLKQTATQILSFLPGRCRRRGSRRSAELQKVYSEDESNISITVGAVLKKHHSI